MRRLVSLIIVGALALTGCAEDPITITSTRFEPPPPVVIEPPATPTPVPSGGAPQVDPSGADFAPNRLLVDVIETRPHDDLSFTQGLLLDGGVLFESAGPRPQPLPSTLRRVDPISGDVLASVEVPDVFAEGLALVDGRLIQLTWRDSVALVYDAATLELTGQFTYDTEGWGLCYDGARLVMSDGSAQLYFRDAATFELQDTVSVTLDGAPVERLNELECVGDRVWANVWQTDQILEIDPASGVVTSVVDASSLLLPRPDNSDAVLNGIAYDPATGNFLVTGKLWPELYVVRFVEPG